MYVILLMAGSQLVMNIFDEKSNKHKFDYDCLTFNTLNDNEKLT